MGIQASILAIVIALTSVIAYYKGRDSRADEIVALQSAIQASNTLAREWEDRAKTASAKVVTKYIERVKTIREEIPGEIQLVEVIRNTSDCELPGAFRLLHDRAASGSADAENPAGTDAAPVPAQDAAATVAENYRIARENAARLEALQAIITAQQ